MHSKAICFILIGLVVINCIQIFQYTPVKSATGNIIYVDDSSYIKRDGTAEYPLKTIQDALNRAENGDTIYVFGGLYSEHLIVNKEVDIVGSIENGPSIIEILEDERYTIEITKDYVTLESFTIQDTGDHKSSPIGALISVQASDVVIQGNYINDTQSWGIYLDPLSSGSVISGNYFNNTNKAIYVDSSDTNDIFNNIITNCIEDGIYLTSATNNRLYQNTIQSCAQGINVYQCANTNITNNTLLENTYNGISIYGGTNAIIKGNHFEDNSGSGIYMQSPSCTIINNFFESNRRGVHLDQSNGHLQNNTFANNTASGIFATAAAQDNLIILNKFKDNSKNAHENGANIWYQNEKGNYWSDYNNIDRDKNGIGDSIYSLNNVNDAFPLGYFLKPPFKPSNPSPKDFETGVGLSITLEVDVEDPDSETLSVTFYRASDNTLIETVKKIPSGETAKCSFNQPFDTTFAWYAIVNDSLLENQSDIWIFTTRIAPPDNQKPVSDPGGPYAADKNEPIEFDGSGSYDPDGDIDFYRWNFGDGSSEILAKNPAHIYDTSGEFIVTLTVVDNNGRSDIKTTTIDISADPYNFYPIPDLGGPYSGYAQEAINFDASKSYDKDGSITKYEWQFGDGTTAVGMSPSHSYAQPGGYTINLTVTDDLGATETTQLVIIVKEQPQTPGFEFIMALSAILIFFIINKSRK